jgi:hypothetical protein
LGVLERENQKPYGARNSGRGGLEELGRRQGRAGYAAGRRYESLERDAMRPYAGLIGGAGGQDLWKKKRLCAKCRFWEKKFVQNVEKFDLTFW